jgi:ABC-type multidrug transport system ATPase subunit
MAEPLAGRRGEVHAIRGGNGADTSTRASVLADWLEGTESTAEVFAHG